MNLVLDDAEEVYVEKAGKETKARQDLGESAFQIGLRAKVFNLAFHPTCSEGQRTWLDAPTSLVGYLTPCRSYHAQGGQHHAHPSCGRMRRVASSGRKARMRRLWTAADAGLPAPSGRLQRSQACTAM